MLQNGVPKKVRIRKTNKQICHQFYLKDSVLLMDNHEYNRDYAMNSIKRLARKVDSKKFK